MSDPQRASGPLDCPIVKFCRRAEEIVRRCVEECRNDRRTLAYWEQFPQVEAEREALRAFSLRALKKGAEAIPPLEMERRLDAVLRACKDLLYEIPLRHRCGDPPGLTSLEKDGAGTVAYVRASDEGRLRMLKQKALEAIENAENVSLMLPDASGADRSADSLKKKRKSWPSNNDVVRLYKYIQQHAASGRSMNEIAQDFEPQSRAKPDSLVRQLRRHRTSLEEVLGPLGVDP
jgi:hypothetical protein